MLWFCLVDVWSLVVHFANTPSQLFWEGKLGEPKEEIWNLNGFDYMYLSELKVPYFEHSSSISIKVISMGTTGCRGNTAQALAWWRHPAVSNEALDKLHQVMRPASYRRIGMVIRTTSNLHAFLVVVDYLLAQKLR
jgi:hypothetical protein